MKNTVILFSLLLSILVAVGCSSNNSVESGSGLIGNSFVGGSSAIKLSFVENSPPQAVTALSDESATGQEFKVTVRADNFGEHEIDAELLILSLSGFFPDDFGVLSAAELKQKNAKVLPGVKLLPDGRTVNAGITHYHFPSMSYNKAIQGDQTFPLRVDACYPYQTNVLSEMCLMEDFTSNRDDSSCNPTGPKQVSNSGAPVKVTNVHQSAIGKNKFQLNFDVEKVGSGNIFKYECEDHSFDNKNRVTVQVNTGLKGEIECLGLIGGGINDSLGEDKVVYIGELLMPDGKGSFTCIQTLGVEDVIQGSALKSITLTIDYSVSDFIETDILVKRFFS